MKGRGRAQPNAPERAGIGMVGVEESPLPDRRSAPGCAATEGSRTETA